MVLTIDFKVKVSSLSKMRTVGLWAEGKFMQVRAALCDKR
jgi:hypothetical protein